MGLCGTGSLGSRSSAGTTLLVSSSCEKNL